MTSRTGTIKEFAGWTRRVVAEPEATSNDPRHWFDDETARRKAVGEVPVEAVVKLLSEENLTLLRLIQRRHPRSVRELAELAGRKGSNLSRTLKKLANAGIVRLEPGEGRTLAPRLVALRVTLDLDLVGHGGAMSLAVLPDTGA